LGIGIIMNEYSSLIFDIDNTAIPDGVLEVTSDRLIQAVSRTARNVPCIAATGRTPELALPIIQQLELRHLTVVANGAALMDPSNGELIDQRFLTTEQVDTVLKGCGQGDYKIIIEGDDIKETSASLKRQPRETLGVFVLGIYHDEAHELADLLRTSVAGLYVYVSEGWKDDGELTYDVNISHELATKERAAVRALGTYGLLIEKAVVVGDGLNDAELMRKAGLAVAVENAHPEIIKLAHLVVPDVFNDGLAFIIEKIF